MVKYNTEQNLIIAHGQLQFIDARYNNFKTTMKFGTIFVYAMEISVLAPGHRHNALYHIFTSRATIVTSIQKILNVSNLLFHSSMLYNIEMSDQLWLVFSC